ncbi:hypothetical protein ACHAXN_009073 [Cyclotella atomus]
MVQATSFLLRWLFLCRLVDDRAEVQTWPYRPPGYFDAGTRHQSNHQAPPPPSSSQQTHHPQVEALQEDNIDIPTFRESIIRSLTSHPPGSTERLQRLDELRLQVVNDFAKRLLHADEVVRFDALRGSHSNHRLGTADGAADGLDESKEDDLDADNSIQTELQSFLQKEREGHDSIHSNNFWQRFNRVDETQQHPNTETDNPFSRKSQQQIQQTITSAQLLLSETRSFLPQLVSTVLHSPPALLPSSHSNTASSSSDPISSLRTLLLNRCQIDPSFGIELCWLLEAEVGRKWKALFEHRQQTGKRLILIVQADIAQAIATIGAEKASAFNLLQDAEMATAFGMERRYEVLSEFNGVNDSMMYHSRDSATTTRLPKSISDLRCRHFGDSMHFVDRLSQISLDLRHVAPVHRKAHLQERLRDLNTRLCRRMISRGKISVDVESDLTMNGYDNHYTNQQQYPSHHHHYQWTEENIRQDMIQYSVHFPMEPQSVRWPGGWNDDGGQSSAVLSDFERPQQRNGVVRALRILPEQCRVLDSRERCPFLVRMEVAESGLEANDARLYAGDVTGVGLTVEESLGSQKRRSLSDAVEGGFAFCEIPPELMNTRIRQPKQHEGLAPLSNESWDLHRSDESHEEKAVPRGGYQGPEYDNPVYGDYNTYEMVRDHHYQQLHQEIRDGINQPYYDAPMITSSQPLSTGSNLLDRVFGKSWNSECEAIRQQSPFRDVQGWRLASFIIKAGEDIRKEALVMQIMSRLWTWFQAEIPPHLRPFLRPYTIMCVGGDAGLVECLPDVKSVNEVKKVTDGFTTLLDFFHRAFRPVHPSIVPSGDTVPFEKARDNFLRSLVGYSVVCYILQIKDRHNANILMDREGHIMHIDFGFVLGETPKMGKVPLFSERAPFKLSAEFWEVIGGWSAFKRFCEMFEAAYAVAAAHSDEICSLVEAAIVNVSRNSDMARSIADGVRRRMEMKADPKEQKMHIMNIVNDAITSWGTSTYDWLQRSMNGYQ